MNLLKKLKSIAVMMFFLGFLASATLISCGKQGESSDKESTEHPADGEEAEKSEHPEKKADEHPTEKADTTKTEAQQ